MSCYDAMGWQGHSPIWVLNVNVSKSPKTLKREAIEMLENIKTRNKIYDWRVGFVIRFIEDSLSDDYWVDEDTLNTARGRYSGLNVFMYERIAITICNHYVKGEVCKDVSGNLVEADRLIAQTAIDDAKAMDIVNPANENCFDLEIRAAKKQMDMAQDGLGKKYPQVAIRHFEQAWLRTLKAAEYAQSEKKVCGRGR